MCKQPSVSLAGAEMQGRLGHLGERGTLLVTPCTELCPRLSTTHLVYGESPVSGVRGFASPCVDT